MSKKSKRIQRRKLNRYTGEQFEWYVTEYFNNYMDKYGMDGLAYIYPLHPDHTQKIDVLIDNFDSMFIGIECKSIYEDGHPLHTQQTECFRNARLYFSKLFNINKTKQSQIYRQRQFLRCTNRYGLIAFEFRCLNEVFFVPYNVVYRVWKSGRKFITVKEVITNSYQIGSSRSLIEFIANKCEVTK